MNPDDEAPSKPYWQLSQEEEEGWGNEDMEYQPGTDADDADETTDSGVGCAGDDTTDGGERTDGSQPKRRRRGKDRRPNTLGTERQEFTQVDPAGVPLEPVEYVRGYGIQLGCIMRDTISINTENIRDRERGALRTLLLQKLHRRYKFPDAYDNTSFSGNKVNQHAITKMSTALSSWKSRVKKKIEAGKTYEQIHATEPSISKDDFNEFKAWCDSEEAKLKSDWGKAMHDKNIGHHNLGSGGYRGKQPIWAKEDAELARQGLENPFDRFNDPWVRNFVRARYRQDPETNEFRADPKAEKKVKDFELHLVSFRLSSRLHSN
jgi:hypothetical protein